MQPSAPRNITFEGSRSYNHENYPSQTYLARVNTANTSSALGSHRLGRSFRILEDVAGLTRALKLQARAVSTGELQPLARFSWYVNTATVRSFITVEIETMPIQHGGNLV